MLKKCNIFYISILCDKILLTHFFGYVILKSQADRLSAGEKLKHFLWLQRLQKSNVLCSF
jgi:hypothetical protein